MTERGAAFGAFDWGAVVVSVLGVVGSLAFTFLVMPSVLQMYRDLGGELPLLTRMTLSRGFMGGMTFVGTMLVVAGVSLRLKGKAGLGRGMLAAGALLSVLIVITVVIGTYLPIFALAGAVRE